MPKFSSDALFSVMVIQGCTGYFVEWSCCVVSLFYGVNGVLKAGIEFFIERDDAVLVILLSLGDRPLSQLLVAIVISQ